MSEIPREIKLLVEVEKKIKAKYPGVDLTKEAGCKKVIGHFENVVIKAISRINEYNESGITEEMELLKVLKSYMGGEVMTPSTMKNYFIKLNNFRIEKIPFQFSNRGHEMKIYFTLFLGYLGWEGFDNEIIIDQAIEGLPQKEEIENEKLRPREEKNKRIEGNIPDEIEERIWKIKHYKTAIKVSIITVIIVALAFGVNSLDLLKQLKKKNSKSLSVSQMDTTRLPVDAKNILLLNFVGDNENNDKRYKLADTLGLVLEEHHNIKVIEKDTFINFANEQGHDEARRIGKEYDPSIGMVIWGKLSEEGNLKTKITIVNDTVHKYFSRNNFRYSNRLVNKYDVPNMIIEKPVLFAKYISGIIHYRKNEYKKALIIFEDIIKVLEEEEIKKVVLLKFLGSCEMHLALKTDESKGNLSFSIKDKKYQYEDFKKAIRYFERSIKVDSLDEKIYDNLGTIYSVLEDFEKAEFYYMKADSNGQDQYWTQVQIGSLRLSQGKLNESIEISKTALRTFGNKYALLSNLGNAFFLQRKMDSALYYYNLALEQDSSIMFSWFCIGDCHAKNKEWKEAIVAFEKALSLSPENQRLMVLIGGCYIENNNIAIAESILLDALKIDGEEYYVNLYLGLICDRKNDFIKAKKYYEKAISIDTQIPEGWINLGLIFLKLDNPPRAIELLETALSIHENNIDGLNLLAYSYVRKGDITNAKRVIQKLEEHELGVYGCLAQHVILTVEGKSDIAYRYIEIALSQSVLSYIDFNIFVRQELVKVLENLSLENKKKIDAFRKTLH